MTFLHDAIESGTVTHIHFRLGTAVYHPSNITRLQGKKVNVIGSRNVFRKNCHNSVLIAVKFMLGGYHLDETPSSEEQNCCHGNRSRKFAFYECTFQKNNRSISFEIDRYIQHEFPVTWPIFEINWAKAKSHWHVMCLKSVLGNHIHFILVK